MHRSATSHVSWDSWRHSLLTALRIQCTGARGSRSALLHSHFFCTEQWKRWRGNNVLLMTCSLSQRSQPSLLIFCTAQLWPCATTWLYTSTREVLENMSFCSQPNVSQLSQKCATANISAQSIGDLGKQIAFIWASACFESHDLISNCYCCNSLEDLLKLADSSFLASIRMPNLPPSTSSEGS